MNRKKTIEEIFESFGHVKRSFSEKGHEHTKIMPVTFTQAHVLHLVKKNTGSGIKEIANCLGITSSATTQLVDGLVKKGYLKRTDSLSDRRALKLELTKKAKDHFVFLRSHILKRVSFLFSSLSDQELQTFLKLCQKITKC